jgi:two-component system alkaline phosphatase synthesis response regulator PhoP
MSKILLVDDEHDIVEFLKYNLELEKYEVIVSYDGKDALKKISDNPDLVLLDIMMPQMDGFEVYEKIRDQEKFRELPIIFFTAKSGEMDEIKGLDLGASDYIQKPISPKKLVARVKSNLRKNLKSTHKVSSTKATKIDPLIIDIEKYTISIEGKLKFFPRKEFQLLNYLAGNPGKVFSREILLKEIWGDDVYVVDRTVDVHIRKIREKLGDHFGLIETIKGVGYRFKSVE